MAPRYDSIRTAAARPVSPDASVVERYRAMPFPEEWTGALLTLCNAGRDKPLEAVPTFRMDQVVQALAPDVLVRPRPNRHREDGRDFWLYAPEDAPDPLPDVAFRGLLSAWLKDLRPEPEFRSLLSETRSALLENPPRWQEGVPVKLLRHGRSTDGGTASPESRQFQLSTDWLARRILALEPYVFAGGRLRFRAMPRGPMDRGAELVSQALEFEGSRGSQWYSVVLNVTLQTVPFDPLPRFHVHSHIRRYATRVSARTGRLYLPFGRRTTVLLRPRVPWLPGAPASDRFAVARLAWSRSGYDWVGGGPAGMLRSMSLTESFPDADAILTDPAGWLTDDMRAAVLYSTAMGSHEVGAGLMTDQRSQIVEWALQALPEQLEPVPALVRTRLSGSTPGNPRQEPSKESAKAEEERRRAEARRRGAAFALCRLPQDLAPGELPVLEARLLWQTPVMRDTAVDALVTHLGLKGDGGAPATEEAYDGTVVLEWQSPELTVRLRCRRLSRSLGQDLALPEGTRHSRAAVTTAIRDRRRGMTAFLAEECASSSAPTLALVEIDRAKDFSSPDHDAKFALRLGCADAGVLTQFMAVPKKAKGYNSEKNKEFRAAKAWDDGLRQLGVRVHPQHSLGGRLPADMRYAAVWMVRRNRRSRTRWAGHVPVAVLVTPDPSGEGLARVEGWDDEARAWVPYPVMLLKLTRQCEVPKDVAPVPGDDEAVGVVRPSWWTDMAQQRRDTEEWLQRVRRTLRGTPTMLLAHGQNMRSHWTWLQDGTVVADKFRDGHAPARRLDPDLRLVRVRTARNRETAQWWGVNPDGPNGLAAHLWTDPTADPDRARVFWSTTPKARTFKLSVAADKLAPRVNTKGKVTIDTDKAAWNPGLVEIAVLGCHPGDGDVPEALALAVHQLRQAPDLPDALSLPLPLHLAGLAQEYVLPTRSEDGGDGDDAVDSASDADPDTAAAPGTETAPEQEETDWEQLALAIPAQSVSGKESRAAQPR